ncbi:histidine kinase [Malaciobacter molluscorum LMG 25693]|uniref:histidine kinase n=1 Tax=Malaciobacter molluscorum LMG 25693 TaxID=870501 RepID=A0A2G1DG55_9BACT|nr:ABC transporter substrate binding protein [Malaciobacter molluscorum]AXX93507.1 two-component system sensor histidine kinase [Malaciobacter molluscorum LMG 25693]PHO17481.1 histidine kinase [Malaciobacter molluscorum LMG 25693]RXJ93347.1 histidine kinase [Malaciobacter molluscorum]
MQFKFIILFLPILIFANSQKDILLLHSYNIGLKWTDNITKGVKEVFDKYPDYELTTECMDSKKINSKVYFNTLKKLYEQKFSSRHYKVILVADNYALNFVVKNHKKIFNNSPIVFCGIENYEEMNIPEDVKKKMTGVIEYKQITKNIEVISRVIPKLNTLYIISDDTLSSLAIKNQIIKESKQFTNKINIIYDNKIDINTITDKVNKLPENSAVLFTSLYRDIKGRFVIYNELRQLFNNSKYPVFAINKIHLGEGIIGGVVVDPEEQGRLAAAKAFELINGKNIKDIPIETPDSKYYFDYHILKKYHIDFKNIPEDAIIINKPKTFFEEYRKVIDNTFLLMPIFILLILGLIVNIIKKIRLENRLLEQSKLDKVLLNNIQSIVYWESKDNKLLGCNEALCTFLNISKKEIIKKEIREIMPEINELFSGNDTFIEQIETNITLGTKEFEALIRRKKYLNKDNEEAGIVTIISDVTQIKILENQRKKNEQFLIHRSKLSELGEMITSIAHQWKTPLIEISTIAQELLYKRSRKSFTQEDSKEIVDEIMTQVSYMTDTIDNFRDFVKPSLKKSKFEINSAIVELLKVVEHNIKYNYIEVNLDFKNNKLFKIYGYPNEFKQCILSIINNSKDSILKRKQTNPALDGKIDIKVEDEDDCTCIYIKDNGIGIEDSHLDRIFEPFFTSKKDGDGFGLYMVKLIIEEKMDGSIAALRCNQGAIIKICIKK